MNIQPERARHLLELVNDIRPLAVAQIVEELAAAHAAELRAGQLALLSVQIPPQCQVRQEVRGARGEPGVKLIRLCPLFGGALADILHREGGDQNEHLGGAAVLLAFNEHAAEPGIQRESGQLAADSCVEGRGPRYGYRWHRSPPGAGYQRVRRPLIRRINEGELGDVAKPQRDHLEDHRGERGALNLRLGELVAMGEVFFRVQANADAVRHAPTSARALIGAGLRHWLNGQALHLGLVGVARDARRSRIHHVPDSRNGQRGFGDVRCQDDTPILVAFEDAVLFRRGEPSEEGKNLNSAGNTR